MHTAVHRPVLASLFVFNRLMATQHILVRGTNALHMQLHWLYVHRCDVQYV